jgi:hypothetical protein
MSGKRFKSWTSRTNKARAIALSAAATAITSSIESGGLKLSDTAIDESGVPPHCLNFERFSEHHNIDFVLVIFDKYHRLRFQIIFGRKGAKRPYPWIKSGSLVWKMGRDQIRFKWWGPRWWRIGKLRAFKREVASAAEAVLQVSEYLEFGKIGRNVCLDPRVVAKTHP